MQKAQSGCLKKIVPDAIIAETLLTNVNAYARTAVKPMAAPAV
jgi:hypothetical protein